MSPTRWPALLLLVSLGALAGVALLGLDYDRLAALSAVTPIGLVLLALAEAWGGTSARARLARRPGTRALDPLVAARLAVLAKASSAGGAVVGGFFAGALGWLLAAAHGSTAQHDTAVSGAGVVAAAALTGVALWLEHVCRLPPEDQPRGGRSASPGLRR